MNGRFPITRAQKVHACKGGGGGGGGRGYGGIFPWEKSLRCCYHFQVSLGQEVD